MFHRFIMLLGLCSLWPGLAQADFSLTVLHTNDFHARLVTAVAEARARAQNSILVDGGDQF